MQCICVSIVLGIDFELDFVVGFMFVEVILEICWVLLQIIGTHIVGIEMPPDIIELSTMVRQTKNNCYKMIKLHSIITVLLGTLGSMQVCSGFIAPSYFEAN